MRPGVAASRQDLEIRHPAAVPRTLHRRLPVVPLPQALLPAAAALRHDTLRLVLARAEFHNRLSLSSLQASLGSGRVGSRALRIAMDAHLPQLARCVTRLERDFVLLCERLGLPLPEPNERIGRYRPDMLWREAMLIVELDGEDAHHTPAQIAADLRARKCSRRSATRSCGSTGSRSTGGPSRSRPRSAGTCRVSARLPAGSAQRPSAPPVAARRLWLSRPGPCRSPAAPCAT